MQTQTEATQQTTTLPSAPPADTTRARTEMAGVSPPTVRTVLDWSAPDYGAVFAERRDRLLRLRSGGAGMVAGLWEHYASNPADFVEDWGCTFDPRNAERGLPTLVPFVLFPKQRAFLGWLYDRWRGGEDGLAEKSRDMGVSWLCVSFGIWMWIFHEGSVVGFGSRKEEYVDNLGDPKSLFWKAREFVKWLPDEFRPEFDAPYMRIINKDNGSVIIGEAGSNIGRGNRASVYFVDEAAFLEKQESVDAALSQTSNCKIYVSTPNGNGNAFYRRRMGGKCSVFTFDWRSDPRKDDAWYAKQVAALDPVIVAQEIDISYEGSVSNVFIDGKVVIEAQGRKASDVEAVGPWLIGVDAAHEGNDESVIHASRGRFNMDQLVFSKMDGPALAGAVESAIDDLLGGGGELGQIVIELDGPGVSCYDQLKRGRYKRYVVGIHTGAKLKDSKHYNLRAKLWALTDEYLKEGGVLLPRCPEFKAQLCAMQYTYKNGLLLMQSKKDYKGHFKRSPDRADAFVLTRYPYNPRRFMYSDKVQFADAEYDELV